MGIENLSGLRYIPKFGLTQKLLVEKARALIRVRVAEHSVNGMRRALKRFFDKSEEIMLT